MTDDEQLPIGRENHGAEISASLDALIEAYADARVEREEASALLKRLSEVEARLEGKLFDELERLNLRSVRHTRGLFILNDLAWASVTDEAAVREWANAEMPEILSANRNRLAMIVRAFLKGERQSMPPGLEPKFSRRIGWRRS